MKRVSQSRQRSGVRKRSCPNCSEKLRAREGRRYLLPHFGHSADISLHGCRNRLPPRNIAAKVSIEGVVQAFADIAAVLEAAARDLAHPQ